ncbi:hypothetical protein AAU57_07180 [Nonlabens sp. YIK11]|nr:hypothetical protein AAU57_05105 [Nonlabens sp. YIK11]KQC33121.1 hypothetical protein AAU57_07180 [Nonlabens sp. YIK11]
MDWGIFLFGLCWMPFPSFKGEALKQEKNQLIVVPCTASHVAEAYYKASILHVIGPQWHLGIVLNLSEYLHRFPSL